MKKNKFITKNRKLRTYYYSAIIWGACTISWVIELVRAIISSASMPQIILNVAACVLLLVGTLRYVRLYNLKLKNLKFNNIGLGK